MVMKKIIAVILILALMTNMVLFGMGKLDAIIFWGIILACGLITYLLKYFKV